MTLPTNAPGGSQRPAQALAQGTAEGSAQAADQEVVAPVPPDQIDFSRLVEEQFQIALAEDEEERAARRRLYLYTGIGIVAVVLILAFAILATIFGWWPVILDIVLVLVVLLNGVLLVFLTLAVINFMRTIREMRDEITPVITSLRDTTTTVRETAKTASSYGVNPVVRTASMVLGAAGVAGIALGPGKAKGRSAARQKRREEIEKERAEQAEKEAQEARSATQTGRQTP
jgi:ABC-type multidrug transport system fused ATPase/permease subunit